MLRLEILFIVVNKVNHKGRVGLFSRSGMGDIVAVPVIYLLPEIFLQLAGTVYHGEVFVFRINFVFHNKDRSKATSHHDGDQ